MSENVSVIDELVDILEKADTFHARVKSFHAKLALRCVPAEHGATSFVSMAVYPAEQVVHHLKGALKNYQENTGG